MLLTQTRETESHKMQDENDLLNVKASLFPLHLPKLEAICSWWVTTSDFSWCLLATRSLLYSQKGGSAYFAWVEWELESDSADFFM